jgi:hypothetical protein
MQFSPRHGAHLGARTVGRADTEARAAGPFERVGRRFGGWVSRHFIVCHCHIHHANRFGGAITPQMGAAQLLIRIITLFLL